MHFKTNATRRLVQNVKLVSQKAPRLVFFLTSAIFRRFLSIPLGLDSEFTLSTSLASSVFSSVYGGSYFGVEVAFEYFIDKFSDINDK